LQRRAPDASLPGVTVDEAREPLGEDAPQAGGVPAEEAPHVHPERHGHAAPRHIGDRAHRAAVDATGRMLTRRARGGRCVFVKAEAFEMGQERRGIHALLQAGATTAQPASVARTAPDGPPRSSKGGKTHDVGHIAILRMARNLAVLLPIMALLLKKAPQVLPQSTQACFKDHSYLADIR